jgi:hypothetical protein
LAPSRKDDEAFKSWFCPSRALGRKSSRSHRTDENEQRNRYQGRLASDPGSNPGDETWLGHKNIQHTVRYTELAPDRFKNFWR